VPATDHEEQARRARGRGTPLAVAVAATQRVQKVPAWWALRDPACRRASPRMARPDPAALLPTLPRRMALDYPS